MVNPARAPISNVLRITASIKGPVPFWKLKQTLGIGATPEQNRATRWESEPFAFRRSGQSFGLMALRAGASGMIVKPRAQHKGIVRRLAHQLARRIDPPADPLTRLADHYRTDKGSRAGGHHYTRVYSELFGHLRESPVRLLEIGLMGLDRRGWDDELLRDQGAAHGHDALRCGCGRIIFRAARSSGWTSTISPAWKIPRCRIFRGDASKEADLLGVLDQIGGQLDIVIDDASHASDHQQISLGTLFPAVAPGGVYIIEDLFYQPPDREPAGATKTVDMLRRAEVTKDFSGSHLSRDAGAYLNEHVERVALFDLLAVKRATRNRDGLGVLWKRN